MILWSYIEFASKSTKVNWCIFLSLHRGGGLDFICFESLFLCFPRGRAKAKFGGVDEEVLYLLFMHSLSLVSVKSLSFVGI